MSIASATAPGVALPPPSVESYIPRIDHERRQAIVVNRYPSKKVCARITVRPLAETLRVITASKSQSGK